MVLRLTQFDFIIIPKKKKTNYYLFFPPRHPLKIFLKIVKGGTPFFQKITFIKIIFKTRSSVLIQFFFPVEYHSRSYLRRRLCYYIYTHVKKKNIALDLL